MTVAPKPKRGASYFRPVGEKLPKRKSAIRRITVPRTPAELKFAEDRRRDMKARRAADPLWNAKAAAAKSKGRALPRAVGLARWQKKIFLKQARFEATLMMKKLDAAGVLDDADEQARSALHYALATMKDMTTPVKEGLVAARLVLDFTKAKPAQKTEVTISKAEEWLEAVTTDSEALRIDYQPPAV